MSPDPSPPALPVWRSLLYVPANNERFVAKAHVRGADAVILDLEDGVPAPERPAARAALVRSVAAAGQGGADVLVRINRPLRDAVRDLEAAVVPGLRGLVLPKTEGPDHLRLLAEVVAELEAERGLAGGAVLFVPVVESPAALVRAEAIASAHARVAALVLGGEDFALAAGMEPDAETLHLPKLLCLLAARAAGVVPLGFIGTVADYADLGAFRAMVRRSRRFGFEGASCIHPSGVPILNEEMAPAADAVERARRVVEAYDAALAAGRGAVTVDGRMVDVPVAERARRLLARHAAIAARAKGRGGG